MKRSAYLFLLLAILFLFWGCGSKKNEIKTIKGDPAVLYKQGLVQFNKRNYSDALKIFEEIKSNYPDSPPYSLWAELKIGDCHFFKEEYVEAIAAYEEFKKAHPTNEEIPYVYYQIGMSYFNQILTYDRDQTPTRKALSTFEYLVQNFPPSLFTEKAKEKIKICQKQLARHEFYIGNFYYKEGKYQAAASRFEKLLKNFPNRDDEDKTLYLLGRCYLELDQIEKGREVFQKIIDQYPKSSYFKESKAIIDQGLQNKKTSPKGREKKEKEEIKEGRFLIKFEEDGRKPLHYKEEKVDLSILPQMVELKSDEEKRISFLPKGSSEEKEEKLQEEIHKEEEDPNREGKTERKRENEALRMQFLSESRNIPLEDLSTPIDINSDRVEGLFKENVILFKGNVVARQGEITIYSDVLEAMLMEDGKGIEKVVARGNVKIQQALRVAHCEKATFYNREQKVVLGGNPRIYEGENMVSGDEIIIYLEKNRVEVKGGPGGRGKVRFIPKEVERNR
ncbi:MAG: lipopolysaccharide transport periplasmic protein LptA [Thermodesulfobacteriota bacterium]